MTLKMLRPDSKGRISLGHLAAGVSGFSVNETSDHKIILTPYSEIPSAERWLFENKEAFMKIQQGLDDSAAGRVSSRGSFAQFIEEDE